MLSEQFIATLKSKFNSSQIRTNPIKLDEILEIKLEMLSKLDFDYLITSNPGCYLQLEKGRLKTEKSYKVMNLIEFLDEFFYFNN